MFEAYLNLLDEIKRRKFSLIVAEVRNNIMASLKSDKFSGKLHSYLNRMDETGEPFSDFANEPKPVSQIKKIINALYHGEVALADLESVNLRDGTRKLADLAKIYNHTIHHIYQASYLATHLDVDISELFSKEISIINPLLNRFNEFAKNHTKETSEFLSTVDYRKVAHKTGEISGIVVDQLKRQDGEVDYEFLTQFTADVPAYLDKFSAYIQHFSAQVVEKEPTLDKRKIEELQNHALLLLNSLEQLQEANSFFLSLRVINYIHIIRHTITLTMSIIQQASHVSDTSQEVIRDNLAKLKYQVLPQLFGYVDKIEDHAMLRPGLLSEPLMASIRPMYRFLMQYIEKVVDFSEVGQELLTIEDGRFVELRVEQSYQRLAENEKKLLLLDEAQQATELFFGLLERPEFRGKRLVDVPSSIKQQLLDQFKLMQPYVAQFDLTLSNTIITALTTSKGYWGVVSGILGRYSDGINQLLLVKQSLQNVLIKERKSFEFQRWLSLDVLDAMNQSPQHLTLFPLHQDDKPLSIDESIVLEVDAETQLRFEADEDDVVLTNPDRLTVQQATTLYQFYQVQLVKLQNAEDAYRAFLALIGQEEKEKPLSEVDEALKRQLLSLYRIFQPYLFQATRRHVATAAYDDLFVDALMDKKTPSSQGLCIHDIRRLESTLQTLFIENRDRLNSQRDIYMLWVRRRYKEQCLSQALVPDGRTDRAHFIIKRTGYLDTLKGVRASLTELTQIFNHSVRDKLTPSKTGVPFPELMDVHHGLSQSSQVVLLKRLFNTLHHLEEAGQNLNELNDTSSEITYVRHIARASNQIYQVYLNIKAIQADPYFSLMARDFLQSAHKSYTGFMKPAKPYLVQNDEEIIPGAPEKNAKVLYALNAMMILPEHLVALRQGEELSDGRIEAIQKNATKVAGKIQYIIQHSDSYFRLLLQVPAMYFLFRDLKAKLSLMASSSHDTVLEHLEDIRNDILPKLLIEADMWEDKLGLNPGTLSSSMKMVLDEFYYGLLQPLGLHSQRHLALATSLTPFTKREEAVRQRIMEAETGQTIIRKKLRQLTVFKESLERYKQEKAAGATDLVLQHLAYAMRERFYAAIPVLQDAKKHLDVENLPKEEGSAGLDTVLKESLHHLEDLTDIEALLKASISHLNGLHASHQLTIDTAHEKLTYLETIQEEQKVFNTQYLIDYTRKTFRDLAQDFSSRQFGLVHSSHEYKQRLFNHLKASEEEIVLNAKDSEDINQTVRDLLKEKIKHFERINYEKYYHLEAIMASLEAFKLYIHRANISIQENKSIFESVDTLVAKSQQIETLENIAKNSSKSVDERLLLLADEVSKPTFKTRMLKYHYFEQVCWSWLKQCVAQLLELIGLYTPTYKKRLNHLVDAVSAPPETSLASARFGLFSADSRELHVSQSDDPNHDIETHQRGMPRFG